MDELYRALARETAEWWTDRYTGKNRQGFEQELYDRVLTRLEAHGRVSLSCDYDPQGILLEAVRACGQECSGFLYSAKGLLPFKHTTKSLVENGLGKIKPKEGYGNWTHPIIVRCTGD